MTTPTAPFCTRCETHRASATSRLCPACLDQDRLRRTQ